MAETFIGGFGAYGNLNSLVTSQINFIPPGNLPIREG